MSAIIEKIYGKLLQLDSQKIYFVYIHYFEDGSVYIGKGKNRRHEDFQSGRSEKYQKTYELNGKPKVEIIAENMSEDVAYFLESALVIRARAEGVSLINATDGNERLDIENMPWRTLGIMKNKIKDDKYNRIIHFHRDQGMLQSLCLAATLVEAAVRMECTLKELLNWLPKSTEVPLDGWIRLTNEQALALHPKYASEILRGESF
jgi:predicted GIY-YIG superfamily endonuclease